MRLTISLLVAAVLLAGCTSATPNVPPGTVSATMAEASTATATPTLPADTLPDTQPAEACPYLDAAWVAQTNGQRVTRVGVDTRFDPPACVFWSYSEDPQLTVLVRHMPSPDEAVAVVDWAAPIATTDPAGLVGGSVATAALSTPSRKTQPPWWCSAIKSNPSKLNLWPRK